MAKLTPMAPDSAGFKVLIKLYNLGGKAPATALSEVLQPEFRSAARFSQVATYPLHERGLVRVAMRKGIEWLTITNEGSLMVRRHIASLPEQRLIAMPMKPLDVKKFMSWGQGRPGALDYRAIPSRMGDKRVPYVQEVVEAGGK